MKGGLGPIRKPPPWRDIVPLLEARGYILLRGQSPWERGAVTLQHNFGSNVLGGGPPYEVQEHGTYVPVAVFEDALEMRCWLIANGYLPTE